MAKEKITKSDDKPEEPVIDKPKRAKTDGVKKHKTHKTSEMKAAAKKHALEKNLSTAVGETDAGESQKDKLQKALEKLGGKIRGVLSSDGYRLPFAVPLVPELYEVMILKMLVAGDKLKRVARGVKEVQKAIKPLPNIGLGNKAATRQPYVVIIAADINPMDVISHIPVFCESRSVDYLYTRSRALLGLCSLTKRPASILLIRKNPVVKKNPALPVGVEKTEDAKVNDDVKAAETQKIDDSVKDTATQKTEEAAKDVEGISDDVKFWGKMFDQLATYAHELHSKLPKTRTIV
ncbi:MAG: snoRNA-binding protein [Bathelium mastoideum]|nr:MAG: snoRNA-binding protein [Bathelium mastoideum]KAI9693618.1 MAG: snoRNA-binding protein [Bathelium mastoideum]